MKLLIKPNHPCVVKILNLEFFLEAHEEKTIENIEKVFIITAYPVNKNGFVFLPDAAEINLENKTSTNPFFVKLSEFNEGEFFCLVSFSSLPQKNRIVALPVKNFSHNNNTGAISILNSNNPAVSISYGSQLVFEGFLPSPIFGEVEHIIVENCLTMFFPLENLSIFILVFNLEEFKTKLFAPYDECNVSTELQTLTALSKHNNMLKTATRKIVCLKTGNSLEEHCVQTKQIDILAIPKELYPIALFDAIKVNSEKLARHFVGNNSFEEMKKRFDKFEALIQNPFSKDLTDLWLISKEQNLSLYLPFRKD